MVGTSFKVVNMYDVLFIFHRKIGLKLLSVGTSGTLQLFTRYIRLILDLSHLLVAVGIKFLLPYYVIISKPIGIS